MRYLIMCEGPNEKEIINILLENDCLGNNAFGRITENELLGLTVYHARQIKKSGIVQMELNMCADEVVVLRIGDKQSDKLDVPKEYRSKIKIVEKYCTKPELEILLIIAEGLLADYNKIKTTVKPKDYAKAHIKFGKHKYDNSSAFYREYFGERPQLLIESIIEYKKRNGSHNKDEKYLADLLY